MKHRWVGQVTSRAFTEAQGPLWSGRRLILGDEGWGLAKWTDVATRVPDQVS